MKIMASGPITSWQIYGGNVGTMTDFIFMGSKINVDGDCSHEINKACSVEEKLWETWQNVKKQKHQLVNKGLFSQSYGFSISHVWMWELDHWEGSVSKNWCF